MKQYIKNFQYAQDQQKKCHNSKVIRKMAMNSIFEFGPQGELIFIEGLTKDKNVVIRQQCAKGLG